MAFTKYQKVEKAEVASEKDSQAIRETVRKTGKTSASELTEDERRNLPASARPSH